MALTPEQILELDIASQRVLSGTPGAATATNAGDVANLAYAAKQGYVYKPASNIADLAAGTNNIPASQGTDDIRGKVGDITNQGNQTDASAQPTMTSTELAAAKTQVDQAYAALQTQSQADMDAINQAGTDAGSAYTPLIREAEEEKRTGMGKAIVTAGQRGGLMNTQFAGSAAAVITPAARQAFETLKAQGFDVQTPGNESWVGEGGELARIRDVYSANISKIKDLQQQAIAAAKAAARKFIKEGKMDDYNIAKDLYETARQAKVDENDLFYKQQEAERNAKADKRAETTSSYNIMKDIPLGQSVTVNGETFTGIAIPDATKSFFSGSDIVALMKEIPYGSYIDKLDPNTGITHHIEGLSVEQPDYLTATDDKGNVTFVDKTTLQPVRTIKGIGKSKTQAANVTLNLTQGQSEAISAAAARLNTSKGIKKPDGSGDSFWNTDVYIDERNKYGATPGADTKDFDLQYSWNLNPIDPNANRILNAIGQAPKKKSTSETIGDALGNIDFNDK